MKKSTCFFAVVLVCGLAFIGCASKPKVKDISGPTEILEHKGTAWGIPQPEWVGEVQGTSNQKTLQKALGIDKHIWIVPKSGKNLDFIKTWADQVDARAEIAASIKQEIADFVGASLTGDRDEVDEKIERYSARAEMVTLVGLNKETDWWTRTRSRLTPEADYTEQYNYFVVYSLDEALYQKQIKNAFQDLNDDTVAQLIEHLMNYTMATARD
jgi:hypothetical protein